MCERCLPLSRRSFMIGSLAAIGAVAAPVRTPSALAVPVGPELSILRRESWAGDSRPARGALPEEDVRFLLVHHTASANGADPVAVMRSAYDFHTGPEKGWPDVAYNFFIDQNGVVYEARTGSLDRAVAASATGGSQGFAQLICLLGDFTSVLPTDPALRSLERTLLWLGQRHRLDLSVDARTTFVSRGSNLWAAGETVTTPTIAGHRDMSRTACPGDTFYPYLVDVLRPAVAAASAGAGSPDSSTPDSTSTSTTSTTSPSTTSPSTTSTSTTSTSTTSAPTTSAPPAATDVGTAAPSSTSSPTPAPAVASSTAAPTDGTIAVPGDRTADGSDTSLDATTMAVGGIAAALAIGATVGGVRRHRRGDPPPPS